MVNGSENLNMFMHLNMIFFINLSFKFYKVHENFINIYLHIDITWVPMFY